ncbi:NAD(P)/FAD-dependent oxidoreductase [Dyadobacter pollutisoli]|jgi:flavin-dependent dehydrogenase|uniref:NAD(P)/FAD-dependent oxidoreductase n=1 Tax=Dyadobacter pollutisoli TaxID=2910158 RepID=A0A9E8NJF2_9BACT|nr:NAD(P)/FAD-dependent oxidoreductase [Dyadobacter pollutisoli]WAC15129.1 NAD(P)/FAD-dependent oxidoreductase [Dyadobacter pollutisoli]
METQARTYECAIIGGGLAGLCLSIQLADQGVSVVLFEKNQYPFHKVCGEYISMESHHFLGSLGLPFEDLNLPIINQLGVSSEKGFMLNAALQMGGFGISRYSLDGFLSRIAAEKGVTILQNCRVTGVNTAEKGDYNIDSNQGCYTAEIVCGSYGKYTPQFLAQNDLSLHQSAGSANFIGVKYHIKTDLPANRIELHNFKDGYCGVSRVDSDQYCLCYLTTAQNLRENGKDIKTMEGNVLFRNPFLEKYFTESEFIDPNPLAISNVQFERKRTDTNGIFLLGDAAGSITPLCGNGMSMGMRASKLLANELVPYFAKKQSKQRAVENYHRAWNEAFSRRITAGYYLQNLLGKRNTTDLALRFLSKTPGLMNRLIALTHGDHF